MKSTMMKRWVVLLGSLAALLAMTLGVFAAPQNITASEISYGINETRADAPAGFINVQGGNITPLNLTAEHQSEWWNAVWGSIRLNFTLEDASGNVFYNWGSADVVSGEVYFSNDSTVYFGLNQLVAGSLANATFAQMYNGWANSTSIDNFTETYNLSHAHPAFGITGGESFLASTTPAVNMPALDGSFFNATMLWQNYTRADNVRIDYPVFAALVSPNLLSVRGQGVIADYQVLLPTTAARGYATYYVFAELN